jgi:cell division septal protein FtsQ
LNRRPPHANKRVFVSRKERKVKNRRKPDVLGVLRVGLALLLLLQGVRVAFSSPRLRLERVRLAGTHRYSPERVVNLGAVGLGENIFRVNLVRVSQQLRKEPVVAQAVVTRELPDTLLVEIQERKPALVVVSGGQSFYADSAGIVFERTTAPKAGLPAIDIPAQDLPKLGAALHPEVAQSVWECVRLAKEERLSVRNMRIDEAGELWLNIETYPPGQATASILKVRVGRSNDLAEKFRDVRQALLGWPDLTATAAYLNVMCAGRPAYMRVSQETTAR